MKLQGEAALIEKTSGEFDVEFYKKPSTTAKPNSIVLDTNYKNFAYVWSCRSSVFSHSPMLWILNRDYNLTPKKIELHERNAMKILKRFGYDSKSIETVMNNFVVTRHTNCDYNKSLNNNGVQSY